MCCSATAFTLTGTIRDFQDTHGDFEKEIGFETGIVKTILGSDRKPIYASNSITKTTHGKNNFDQWYRDVPNVNLNQEYSIELTDSDGDGIFTYSNLSFFPIDNLLLGNQQRKHNYHFTYEIHSQFIYQQGQVFNFTGDDDFWLFIDKKLALDIGGVHPARSDSISLDSLSLKVGKVYDFDLFFAERHTTESRFTINTSINFINLDKSQSITTPEATNLLAMTILSLTLLTKRINNLDKIFNHLPNKL
jgi:fibro-slime domain-containing protein